MAKRNGQRYKIYMPPCFVPGCTKLMRHTGHTSAGEHYECKRGHRKTVERLISSPEYLGTPLPAPMPHGEMPTLNESGKPLGIVAGFHTSPGPHFPGHDTRRIYR